MRGPNLSHGITEHVQQLILSRVQDIGTASSQLFRLEEIAREISNEVTDLGFHFAAVQIVDTIQQTVKTVYGSRMPGEWYKMGSHSLEGDKKFLDIQAYIAASYDPALIEIITGWDERFDKFIYEKFGHKHFSRAFVPLIVRRGETGCITKAEPIHFRLEQLGEKSVIGGLTRSLALIPNFPSRSGSPGFEIIGTIEAGYDNSEISNRRAVTSDEARTLFDRCCSYADELRRATLNHVLDVITESAQEIAGADFASLYYPFAPDLGRHSYETWAGASHIQPFRPREDGVGQRAISQMEAQFLRASEPENMQPVQFNPQAWAGGIRSVAALPLIIDAGYSPLLQQSSAKIDAGVLYVGLTEDRAFSDEEKYGLTLFTNLAADAISRAVYYAQAMNSARQLASLHAMASALAHETDTQGLLYSMAGHAQNILTADIVVIYEYDDAEKHFLPAPAVSGRCETSFDDYLPPPALVQRRVSKVAHSPQEVSALLGAGDDERRLRRFVSKEGIVTTTAVPLRFADEAVGVMFIAYRHYREFPRYEADAIEVLAATAAVAIRNRRLLRSREASVAAMAHQLRNPLIWTTNVASGLARHLKTTPLTDDDVKSLSERMDRLAVQLRILDGLCRGVFASLTQETKQGSASETGSIDREIIDAHEEVHRLWDFLQFAKPKDAPELALVILDGHSKLPKLQISRWVFWNVVYSLLDNAVKYADNVSTIRVDCTQQADGVSVLKVRSIGQPIDSGEAERIFWKGWVRRGGQSRTSRDSAGIGLWIARGLMRSIGGELWLELDTENPRLSTFVVSIPAP